MICIVNVRVQTELTVCGHGDDAVRQQLQHVLQALAVPVVTSLGQILLQVEALDRLAARSSKAA